MKLVLIDEDAFYVRIGRAVVEAEALRAKIARLLDLVHQLQAGCVNPAAVEIDTFSQTWKVNQPAPAEDVGACSSVRASDLLDALRNGTGQ